MCDTTDATRRDARAAAPRPAGGTAVDPIRIAPVDELSVTILVDNSFDVMLGSDPLTRRTGLGPASTAATHYTSGHTPVGLLAEHGFSALVSVRRGSTRASLLFDAGLSPTAVLTNADRLAIDLSGIHATVLSHGHFDHSGGLVGLARRLGRTRTPMVLHPHVWTRRRLALAGRDPDLFPTLSKRALVGEGFEVIERRRPSLLLEGSILVTGEIDRTTDFEHGMPAPHQAWNGSSWEHDPLVIDDQALVVHVRGQGLVVLTGCGHAGIVNIVRHAMRLTGVAELHAAIGGFHLAGPAFEPMIGPTVGALTALAPRLVGPGHCTGWRAQHAIAAAVPDAWRPSSSGTTFHLTAA